MADESTVPAENRYARWLGWLGGRKFVFCVGAFLLASFMRWHDKLTGDQYQVLAMAILAIFAGANVAQKGVAAKKESSENAK